MKLAAYYLIVSVSYALLDVMYPRIAQGTVVAFVALLLLIPAAYAEFLRIRRH